MRIKVTRRHIREGRRASMFSCPVALAIKEACDAKNVSVDEDWIEINGVVCKPTKKMRAFIFAFDHRLPVKPFNSTLRKYS